MTSELSFLIELLLKHKLPVATKDLVAKRISEVELTLSQAPVRQPMAMNITGFLPPVPNPTGAPQAASTLAAMARHGDVPAIIPVAPPTEPVAVIAQTPAAVAAMNARQMLISKGSAGKLGKPEEGRTSPRKF